MKANELMIGDWVAYRRDFPDKVDAIAIGGLSVHLEKDGWVRAEDIHPVRFTPEILKKNGFKDDQYFAELLCGEWQILCDCSHIAMRHMAGWSVDIPCGYVHELQHALRLCEIEKEIVL